MITVRTGLSLAATAALFAVSAAVPGTAAFAQDGAAKVHCYGVNGCKGQADCKSAKNDCKGMNDCKGQGFKALTAEQCKAQGGSTTEPR